MKAIISTVIASFAAFFSSFKQIRVQQVFSVVLVGFLFLTSHANSEQKSGALGKAIRDRIDQTETDQSNRPRTTGEFLDEARGDVPAGERAKNITRDSVEALKELGREYNPDLPGRAENLKDNITQNK